MESLGLGCYIPVHGILVDRLRMRRGFLLTHEITYTIDA